METEPTPDRIDSRAADRTGGAAPAVPGPQRLLRVVMAASIVGGPLLYDLGGALSPSIHESGQSSIAASIAANSITDTIHLVAFVLASYLLPVGAVGLAYLAYRRTPWLATIAGLLAVVGWLPFSALTALDDLIRAMAQMPDSGSYAELLDRFSTDAVMNGYLLVYIVGHLVAYVLLGIALRKAGVIPAWAAWSMIASSPLTIAAFGLPVDTRITGAIALTLLVLGCLPAGRVILAGPTIDGRQATPAPAGSRATR